MTDIRKYYNLFSDAWRFFREFAGRLPLSDADWMAEIAEKEKIISQHDSCRRLALKLFTMLEDELEQLQPGPE